jgi:hypothetical protein
VHRLRIRLRCWPRPRTASHASVRGSCRRGLPGSGSAQLVNGPGAEGNTFALCAAYSCWTEGPPNARCGSQLVQVSRSGAQNPSWDRVDRGLAYPSVNGSGQHGFRTLTLLMTPVSSRPPVFAPMTILSSTSTTSSEGYWIGLPSRRSCAPP